MQRRIELVHSSHKKHRHFLCQFVLALGLIFAAALPLRAWTPGISQPNAVSGFVVNTEDRTDVLSFYNCVYNASANDKSKIAWTGSVGGCNAGTTSAAFKDDVLRRINFYRALVGVPAEVLFDPVKNAKAQKAALMMSRNNDLSHTPPTSWQCYSAEGREAASKSNIYLGVYGASAVDGYMFDFGAVNYFVGHRRWLMNPRTLTMGTGDIPGDGTYQSSNAIWIIGDLGNALPAKFAAWPNSGYSPHPLMPDRWSLSYPGANFASATVTMKRNGLTVPNVVVSRSYNNVGDNTIVWEPTGLPSTITEDVVYTVTVSGISGIGGVTSHTYQVKLFDPNRLENPVSIVGSAEPPTSGATYTFNAIPQAAGYELRVSPALLATWTEGAEDSPPPQIEQHTTGSYPLRQTALKRTGNKAFQLVTPDYNPQSFVITRDVIPTATSRLQWYDRARYTIPTTTLDVEVSTDSGSTWTSVFSRIGVGNLTTLWDPNWISRSVNLAAFEGNLVQIRFIMRLNGGSYFNQTGSDFGFFIDDITVTNAYDVSNAKVTSLDAAANSFVLNSSTAGAPLAVDRAYLMRIRPKVGCRWFPDGDLKTVTARVPTGYAAWIAEFNPPITGGVTGDHDRDGIPNGLEYAFGLNPLLSTPHSALPQPIRTGNLIGFSYQQPAGINDVVYGAQWSPDLDAWHNIPDTGGGTNHVFSVNTVGSEKVFLRHKITVTSE